MMHKLKIAYGLNAEENLVFFLKKMQHGISFISLFGLLAVNGYTVFSVQGESKLDNRAGRLIAQVIGAAGTGLQGVSPRAP